MLLSALRRTVAGSRRRSPDHEGRKGAAVRAMAFINSAALPRRAARPAPVGRPRRHCCLDFLLPASVSDADPRGLARPCSLYVVGFAVCTLRSPKSKFDLWPRCDEFESQRTPAATNYSAARPAFRAKYSHLTVAAGSRRACSHPGPARNRADSSRSSALR